VPKLTFFPLGNADCCLIDLAGGEKLLFDFGNCGDPNDDSDIRFDLAAALREDLSDAGRDEFDVVAFTHADNDHVHGASEFFYFEHALEYQGDDRVKVSELWLPAAMMTEPPPNEDARIIQEEARHRLRQGAGVRIFSRPEQLESWLDEEGLDLAAVDDLITSAGTVVPGFDTATHGPEFFVHSPFSYRDYGTLVDVNECSLVLQATFTIDGAETHLILAADTPWENLERMVEVTQAHDNDERLAWHVFKLSHHCSYKSLGPDKGEDITEPVENVKWLFEDQGGTNGIVISPSIPIPTDDTDQPPHRQAAAYYKSVVGTTGFKVTMEHPNTTNPEPLIIWIDAAGAKVEKRNLPGPVIMTTRSTRAG
jgi:hypothetical protein